MVFVLAGAVASKPFEASKRKAEDIVRNQFGDELTAEELRMLCKVGEPSCSFHEYVLAMMVKLGKIDQDDIDACASHFQKLDTDNDGVLTVKDLNEREKEDYATGHGVRETRSPSSQHLGILGSVPPVAPSATVPVPENVSEKADNDEDATRQTEARP